ncbi:response regulator [Sediminitomix flava]|uniref:Response regulator receiver domain-containing protein n=1 Tax=Sediminitomix flava TaxID=379075 RepID=A0A315ZEN5_SEDFL|nr:response regulator [Sediminitomix flava]PWJ43792.1 response regulator receiver domain-containing protein [Sediminitomix flava]
MTSFTILIVDDITSNIQTLVKFLEEADQGYEIMSAISGQMALEIIKKKTPDLIITDWEMPQMDGLELIKVLKECPIGMNIPCIMVTGMRTTAEDLQVAFNHGAVDFIRKPVNKLELWARVNSILQLKKAQKELEEQKNRQLSMKTLQVFQKNQFLGEIDERLNNYILNLDPKLRPEGKSILKEIQRQINTDSEWENFKLHFESVHPNFFHFLQSHDYNLTPKDLRWCAYIRIGLSTKDIANLLNIDYAGARVSKTRLKKKLQLSAEDDLNTFLLRI